MKMERSPKLKGSFLREISRVEAGVRKYVPLDDVYLNLQGNYRQRKNTFPLKTRDGCTITISERFGSWNACDLGLITVTLYDADRNHISGFHNMPSRFTINSQTNHIVSFEYLVSRAGPTGWQSSSLHREESPAKIVTGYQRHIRIIKEVGFYQNNKRHNLMGPALVSPSDNSAYRIGYQWFFFGKEYPLYEVKKMVKNPFNITKQEQLYLTLMLSPI